MATLPGNSHEDCHDAAGSELFDILRKARLPIELQPCHYFTNLIPVANLLAPGRDPSIVPDACMPNIALPDVVTQVGARRGAPRAPRRLLFDVKTIHAGSTYYYSTRARDEQSGAVHERELRVWHDYRAHARHLDAQHSPAGQQPILQRLESFGRTRGLIFGAYGEASADVHDLIAIAATAQADQQWRETGARTATELRAFLISRLRRRLGLAVVQAMARHRIARTPYVGVPRAVVQARRERRRQRGGQGDAWVYEAQDIFGDLARYQASGEGQRDA